MAKPHEKAKIKAGQLLCDYVRLRKVWLDDQRPIKKPKVLLTASTRASPLPSPKIDRKLKVRYETLYCIYTEDSEVW